MTSKYFPHDIEGKFLDGDEKRFQLTKPFWYYDQEKDISVTVPEGFVTDGNSVPKAARGYFDTWEVPEAGVIHDWLYTNPDQFFSHTVKAPLTKAQCDDIHRRILDIKGVRWSKRQTIWGLLRAFGFVAWNKHRKDDHGGKYKVEIKKPEPKKKGFWSKLLGEALGEYISNRR